MNMSNMNNINTESNYLTQYAQHLAEQNKANNTIKSYTKDIELFFKYFNLSPNIILRDQIKEYKDHLLMVKNNDAKSVNRSLSAIKSYNEFLVLKELQEDLVVLSIDYTKVQQSFSSPVNVSIPEVIKFLDKIKKSEPYRNYAIATLIVNTGLRVSEALNIKLNGLILKDDEMTIIGKGSKQRTIILNPKAIEVIKEYITNHRSKSKYAKESEYLFVSNKREYVGTYTIERIFNKYSNKITPHQLRHCYASNTLENDILNLRQLQQQLGHARLDTMQIYTHPTKEKMKSKLSGFSIG